MCGVLFNLGVDFRRGVTVLRQFTVCGMKGVLSQPKNLPLMIIVPFSYPPVCYPVPSGPLVQGVVAFNWDVVPMGGGESRSMVVSRRNGVSSSSGASSLRGGSRSTVLSRSSVVSLSSGASCSRVGYKSKLVSGISRVSVSSGKSCSSVIFFLHPGYFLSICVTLSLTFLKWGHLNC
jgi:hypothetical protein